MLNIISQYFQQAMPKWLLVLLFVVAWLPFNTWLYLVLLMMLFTPNIELGGIVPLFFIPLNILFTIYFLAITIILIIRGQGAQSTVQSAKIIIIIGLLADALFLINIKSTAPAFKYGQALLSDQQVYSPKNPEKYTDCENIVMAEELSRCANMVLAKNKDFKGCLDLSYRASNNSKIFGAIDSNGFVCKVYIGAEPWSYDASLFKDENKLAKVIADFSQAYADLPQKELLLSPEIVFGTYYRPETAFIALESKGVDCQNSFSFFYPGKLQPVKLYLPCDNFSSFHLKLYKYFGKTQTNYAQKQDNILAEWKNKSTQTVLKINNLGQEKDWPVKAQYYIKNSSRSLLGLMNYPNRYPGAFHFWVVFYDNKNIHLGPMDSSNFYILFNDYDQKLSCYSHRNTSLINLSIDSYDYDRTISGSASGQLSCTNGQDIDFSINFRSSIGDAAL